LEGLVSNEAFKNCVVRVWNDIRGEKEDFDLEKISYQGNT